MQKLAEGQIQGKSCEKLIPESRLKKGKTVKELKYYHANRHYVIYQQTKSGIDILTLYHDRMDLDHRLKQLPMNPAISP